MSGEGWKSHELQTLVEEDSPITYGVVKPGEEGSVRFVRGGDLKDGQVLTDALRTITEEVSEQYSRTLLRGGELLMCLVGQPGQVGIAPDSLAGANIARQVGLVRLRAEINSAFVSYFLQSKPGRIALGAYTGGSVQQVINLRDLKKVEIPMPPEREEQKRIVSILDEAFSAIAKAKENAEKNLLSARELFESYLNRVFTQQGPGWQEKTVASLCELENGDRGKNYPKKAEYVSQGIPWINTGHIRPDRTLCGDSMNFITREKFDQLRSGKIRQGDLVYCLRGATLGKTAIVDPLAEGAVASSLVIIRPKHNEIRSRYLYYFLTSGQGQNQISMYSNGAAQPNLGAKSVAKFIVPVCGTVQQEKIVGQIREVESEARRLETIYTQKLANLDELKQSLLQKAFTGQLTARLVEAAL
jgi:type I restriction enzyme S subunit